MRAVVVALWLLFAMVSFETVQRPAPVRNSPAKSVPSDLGSGEARFECELVGVLPAGSELDYSWPIRDSNTSEHGTTVWLRVPDKPEDESVALPVSVQATDAAGRPLMTRIARRVSELDVCSLHYEGYVLAAQFDTDFLASKEVRTIRVLHGGQVVANWPLDDWRSARMQQKHYAANGLGCSVSMSLKSRGGNVYVDVSKPKEPSNARSLVWASANGLAKGQFGTRLMKMGDRDYDGRTWLGFILSDSDKPKEPVARARLQATIAYCKAEKLQLLVGPIVWDKKYSDYWLPGEYHKDVKGVGKLTIFDWGGWKGGTLAMDFNFDPGVRFASPEEPTNSVRAIVGRQTDWGARNELCQIMDSDWVCFVDKKLLVTKGGKKYMPIIIPIYRIQKIERVNKILAISQFGP